MITLLSFSAHIARITKGVVCSIRAQQIHGLPVYAGSLVKYCPKLLLRMRSSANPIDGLTYRTCVVRQNMAMKNFRHSSVLLQSWARLLCLKKIISDSTTVHFSKTVKDIASSVQVRQSFSKRKLTHFDYVIWHGRLQRRTVREERQQASSTECNKSFRCWSCRGKHWLLAASSTQQTNTKAGMLTALHFYQDFQFNSADIGFYIFLQANKKNKQLQAALKSAAYQEILEQHVSNALEKQSHSCGSGKQHYSTLFLLAFVPLYS